MQEGYFKQKPEYYYLNLVSLAGLVILVILTNVAGLFSVRGPGG